MRRAALLILVLATAACDGDVNEDINADPAAVPIGACAELEATIEQQAIAEMNAEIDALIDGMERGSGVGDAVPFAIPSAAAPTGPTERGSDTATDFTTTNTQEKDVDEPDFVKNDGSRIFVLNGRSLIKLAAWPPADARLVSATPLEGEPIEMFLDGDRLVVYTRRYGHSVPTDIRPAAGTSLIPPFPGDQTFALTVYDVSGTAPVPLYRHESEGRYVSARRTGTSLRTVSVAPRKGPLLVYWPDGNVDWSRPNAVRTALNKARSENVKRIRAATLNDWLPRFVENGAVLGQECGSYYATNVGARRGFTTVMTLDLARLSSRRATILNEADEVYASKDRLYLTTRHMWMTPARETQVRQNHTYIFQFDTASDPQNVGFMAAGGVAGHVSDQFSLDEEGGFLRIATTRETWVGWGNRDLTNNVFVLRPRGGRLETVGELNGLARNERIYSARFDGDRGYIVTFRQVDPLFTLSLGNPQSPQVAGELKVPGFSTYIHPLDRNHLLTIGREVSPDGRFRGGVQLQVFDVTSFANPTQQYRYTLGGSSASSEAESDHKAFTFFASRGLLGIPYSDWNAARGSRFSSTLEVLNVSVDGGIVPRGSIEHADLLQDGYGRWSYWAPQIRRSVMMEDFVYSISAGGLKVHDVRDLARPVATVPFPAE